MGGSESKKHKVIIAPWGDCAGWRLVEYKYKSDEIKANTTLKVLCHDLKPDGVLVLVPDTLFGSKNLFGNGSAKDKVGRYEDLINRVREKVEEKCIKENVNCNDPKVRVIPGIGKYGETEFLGKASDIYYVAFFEVVQFILDYAKDSEEIEVYFDSSHGINYFTTTLFSVTYEVLKILSFMKTVTLTVVNSEPPIKGKLTHIHDVHEMQIKPDLNLNSNKYNSSGVLAPYNKEVNMRNGDVIKSIKNIKELCAFLQSFRLGMPLLTLYFKPDSKELKEEIGKFLEEYRKHVKVTEKKVERRLRFTDTMEILLKGWFVFELLDLYQPNIDMEEGINLSELKKFTERIYKDRWTVGRINRDLGELEESLKKLEVDKEWKLYAEVIGKDENKKEPQVDPRNLVAHSGLLYHTTEIKRDGDKFYVRLRAELKDKIKEQLPCQDI